MSQLIRNEKDFWIGVVYVAFGSAAIIVSRNYGMGTALKMGPSYFPTILGGFLIVIGVISLIRSFIKPGSPFGAFAFKGLLLITASIILFGFIVRGAGLVIALPVLEIFACLGSGTNHILYSGIFERFGSAASDTGIMVWGIDRADVRGCSICSRELICD
jgi:hypothetical protein